MVRFLKFVHSSSPTTSNMPNSNTSKTQKINDKSRPKSFPISIKLLKDKKSNSKNGISEDAQSDYNKLSGDSTIENVFEEIQIMSTILCLHLPKIVKKLFKSHQKSGLL